MNLASCLSRQRSVFLLTISVFTVCSMSAAAQSDLPPSASPWVGPTKEPPVVQNAPVFEPSIRGSFYTGLELVLVKPFFEDGARQAGTEVEPTYRYQPSWRFLLGFDTSDGLGARARYWMYDHSTEPLVDPVLLGPKRQSIEAHVLDLDVTQRFTAGMFDLVGAFGVRYGRFAVDGFDANDGLAPIRRTEFQGVGPTAALDVSRPLWGSLNLIANGRGSMLLGSTDVLLTGGADPTVSAKDEDDVVLSLESQAGLEYAMQFSRSRLALRALMEAQIWSGAFTQPGEAGGNHDDTGAFFGGAFSIIYSW